LERDPGRAARRLQTLQRTLAEYATTAPRIAPVDHHRAARGQRRFDPPLRRLPGPRPGPLATYNLRGHFPIGVPLGDERALAADPVARLVDGALVGELTVVAEDGRPITYPLVPVLDGDRVVMTSSALDSRKLGHIKSNPRVCLSVTDPAAAAGGTGRATIQATRE